MVTRSDDAVLLTRPAQGVVLLTLNRPTMRNAMNVELTREWDRVLDELIDDGETRCLVVTGAGTSFCAGADLSWLDQGNPDSTIDRLRNQMLPFYESWLRPRRLPFPVVAAVNGPAIGAGLCLALSCDVRYASSDAVFSTPFIHLGTHSGMGATFLLPDAIGQSRAREMLFTGREVRSVEAREWGLVSAVADDVVAHAVGVATRIAAAGPIAARLTKAGLEAAANGFEASIRWEALAQPVTLTTEDIHEGVAAFRAGRPPEFRGR